MKVLILSIIPIVAFLIGSWIAKRNNQPPRKDREELQKLRATMGKIRTKAAEHSVLGDNFAVITLGIISEDLPDF